MTNAEWKKGTLGDLTTLISSGSTPKGGSEIYLKEGPVMLIRSQNVRMNELTLDDVAYVTDEIDAGMTRSRVRQGDVLLNITGASIGRVAAFELADVRANVNQHVCIIRSKTDKLLTRYLTHLISSTAFQAEIDRLQHGGTRQALTFSQIAEFQIPLPPLAEQRRIAEVLDRAEALRAKRRAALAELDSLTQSLFLDLFGDPMMNPKGWKTCLLEDIANKITDGTHKTPNYTECGIEFLSAKDLKEGGIAWGTGKYISEEEHRDLIKRCNPELGDILLAKSGSLGNVAIIDRSHQFSLFESLCLIKHDRQLIEGQFLTGLLRAPSMLAHLLGKNKGVAIKHLHLVDVRNLRIPLPPIALQQEFARRVGAVEKLKAAQRTALAEQDALFATLQHRAFRGEL